MSKIFIFNMISVDGYFAGSKDELDWQYVDVEFNDFAIDQLKNVETIMFGRVTYEMMAKFWPTDFAIKNNPQVATIMNSTPKVVVSSTLKDAKWDQTRLIDRDIQEEVTKLKTESKSDIAVLGSSRLSVNLIKWGLVDEVRVMVNPVLLGEGRPIFKGLDEYVKLRLLNNRVFESGNVLLTYTA